MDIGIVQTTNISSSLDYHPKSPTNTCHLIVSNPPLSWQQYSPNNQSLAVTAIPATLKKATTTMTINPKGDLGIQVLQQRSQVGMDLETDYRWLGL